ncbi:MAG TPA: TetR/AcrR family transcriptional regulator [Solirubrobacteraceae bacterium]|nr:TetR/AcrR family transcriptional regulator [Solirubrobacteraceae bacterium]
MDGTKRELAPLYRRLPHGPHGLERETVARHQRTRLFGAMIESVAQRGYAGTTVAHVVALAGVSRRAFYEQFSNKEHCFLATHDIVVARCHKRVLDAWLSHRGWANRLRASCQAYLDDVALESKGAHLVLVDSLGIGRKARERLHRSAAIYERIVATGFSVAPDGIVLPPLAPRAIVGGMRYVAFTRIRAGRERELAGLAEELLDWIDCYRSPAAARLCALGVHDAPVAVAAPTSAPAPFLRGEDRRSRALQALTELTREHGYTRLSDPQIAQLAGMSTEAFHRQFANKQECFFAVLDEFTTAVLGSVGEAAAEAGSWPEAVLLGMGALARQLAANPMLTRMAFADLFELGPGMVDRSSESIASLAQLFTAGAPEAHWGPTIAAEAITGALWELASSHVARNESQRLPAVADHLAFIVLAPYIGAEGAVETIERHAPERVAA